MAEFSLKHAHPLDNDVLIITIGCNDTSSKTIAVGFMMRGCGFKKILGGRWGDGGEEEGRVCVWERNLTR